jgi:hypothetical protein
VESQVRFFFFVLLLFHFFFFFEERFFAQWQRGYSTLVSWCYVHGPQEYQSKEGRGARFEFRFFNLFLNYAIFFFNTLVVLITLSHPSFGRLSSFHLFACLTSQLQHFHRPRRDLSGLTFRVKLPKNTDSRMTIRYAESIQDDRPE